MLFFSQKVKKFFIFFILSVNLAVTYSVFSQSQSAILLYEAAASLYNEGKYKESLEVINKGISADPNHVDSYILRAKISFELDEFNTTLGDCYKVLKLSPNNPEVYAIRGDLCMVTDSYGAALSFYNKAIDFSNNERITYWCLKKRGIANMNLNKYAEAYSDMLKAYEYNQTDYDLLYPMADMLFHMKRYEESIYTAEKIVNLDEKYPAVYRLLSKIYLELKELDKSTEYIETYLGLEPESIEGRLDMAEILKSKKDYNEALHYLNEARKLSPYDPRIYKTKGFVFFEMRDPNNGCDNLFKAMQLGYLDMYDYELLETYVKKCE